MTEEANRIDAHIGARIRERRKEIKVTQSALADHLNVTFQQVQKYERGANRVAGSTLWLTAKHLKVPVGYFFQGL